MNNDRVESLLEESIAAANRTTRAVRGIALFILIEVTSALIGAALIAFGLSIESPFLAIIGALVMIVGLIWAATSLKSELDDSAIPRKTGSPLQPLVSETDRAELGLQDLDRKDWYVYSSLSDTEKQAWRDKGMPSLKNWDGKRSFDKWINDDPFTGPAK